jgi:hypothetical protein
MHEGQRHDVTLITHVRVVLTGDQVGASSVCPQEGENVGERPISPAQVVRYRLYLLVEVSPSRADRTDETAGGRLSEDMVVVASATERCSDCSALSDTVVPLLWATNVLTR